MNQTLRLRQTFPPAVAATVTAAMLIPLAAVPTPPALSSAIVARSERALDVALTSASEVAGKAATLGSSALVPSPVILLAASSQLAGADVHGLARLTAIPAATQALVAGSDDESGTKLAASASGTGARALLPRQAFFVNPISAFGAFLTGFGAFLTVLPGPLIRLTTAFVEALTAAFGAIAVPVARNVAATEAAEAVDAPDVPSSATVTDGRSVAAAPGGELASSFKDLVGVIAAGTRAIGAGVLRGVFTGNPLTAAGGFLTGFGGLVASLPGPTIRFATAVVNTLTQALGGITAAATSATSAKVAAAESKTPAGSSPAAGEKSIGAARQGGVGNPSTNPATRHPASAAPKGLGASAGAADSAPGGVAGSDAKGSKDVQATGTSDAAGASHSSDAPDASPAPASKTSPAAKPGSTKPGAAKPGATKLGSAKPAAPKPDSSKAHAAPAKGGKSASGAEGGGKHHEAG